MLTSRVELAGPGTASRGGGGGGGGGGRVGDASTAEAAGARRGSVAMLSPPAYSALSNMSVNPEHDE